MHRSLVLIALLSASALGAQESEPAAEPVVTPYTADDAVAIDPGMTREQVVARLGAPAAVRTSGTYTYLFFVNGCHRTCGTDDIVILDGDRVTDAIFRGLGRRYTGASSSPVGVVPAATLGARPPRAFDATAPSMVRPPEARTTAEPDAYPSTPPAPARPALAAAEAAPAAESVPTPSPAREAAPQAPRRAPVDAFRIVPIVRDSASARARADSTSRP